MPRRSIKEDKNIFQELRETRGYSRAKASELLECISDSRLYRIENGELSAYPEEIIKMADVYGDPNLPNTFCTEYCPLGQQYAVKVQPKDLATITLEVLNLLNRLTQQKDRLIEITVDGAITPDEVEDFKTIKQDLDRMEMTIDSMMLWIDNMINEGKIDKQGLK